jgi:hypothetical protein
MGDILGFVGQIGSAAIQSSAAAKAQRLQLQALQDQRNFVYSNLDPNAVQQQTIAADQQNAQARLALQGQIDPALLAQRYASEGAIGSDLATLGVVPGAIGNVAAQEAVAGVQGMPQGKNAVVQAALDQLKAGATLPPDVEAQLVQAGLEQSGMVTQSASGRGVGGQMLRTILGTAGIQLQQQRQQQASSLLTSAQNLEQSRQNILQSLFPRLSQVQLANLQGAQSVLGQSASMLPSAGLSGSNIANIMLARVGATNQIMQSQGTVAGQGAMAQGQIWGGALGGATNSLGQYAPTLSGWLSPGASAGPQLTQSDLTLTERPTSGIG